MLNVEKIIFEKHEHFIKQTYRNRALIYGANGLHQLVIPVRHQQRYQVPIHEVLIANETPWQKIHWRSITSAYRKSPYFEFFESELEAFYHSPFEKLFDFNLGLTKKIFSLLKLPFNAEFTSSYEEHIHEVSDMRDAFLSDNRQSLPVYNQVFADRHGFISDLSIVDLIFNKGMESKNYLAGMVSAK